MSPKLNGSSHHTLPNKGRDVGVFTYNASKSRGSLGRKHLWNIVDANLDPEYIGPTILPKLQSVRIILFDSSACEDAEVFGCLALFLSMELLHGVSVESARTAINFEDSAISFEYFSQPLCGITRLKKFTYGFHVGSIGTNPYRLIDLHLLHSRTTLEYLELYSLAADQFDPHERACSRSLREFEVLKDARVNLVFGVYTMVFTE